MELDVFREKGKWSRSCSEGPGGPCLTQAHLDDKCGKKTPPLRRAPGKCPPGRAKLVMFNERRRKEHAEIVQEAGDFAEFQGAFPGFRDIEEVTMSQQRRAGGRVVLIIQGVEEDLGGVCDGQERDERFDEPDIPRQAVL